MCLETFVTFLQRFSQLYVEPSKSSPFDYFTRIACAQKTCKNKDGMAPHSKECLWSTLTNSLHHLKIMTVHARSKTHNTVFFSHVGNQP